MQGKALRLRAAISLSLLLAQQGRRDEARAMAGAIYNYFTEGLDIADLEKAKVLIWMDPPSLRARIYST